jgi:hypothetical protein
LLLLLVIPEAVAAAATAVTALHRTLTHRAVRLQEVILQAAVVRRRAVQEVTPVDHHHLEAALVVRLQEALRAVAEDNKKQSLEKRNKS